MKRLQIDKNIADKRKLKRDRAHSKCQVLTRTIAYLKAITIPNKPNGDITENAFVHLSFPSLCVRWAWHWISQRIFRWIEISICVDMPLLLLLIIAMIRLQQRTWINVHWRWYSTTKRRRRRHSLIWKWKRLRSAHKQTHAHTKKDRIWFEAFYLMQMHRFFICYAICICRCYLWTIILLGIYCACLLFRFLHGIALKMQVILTLTCKQHTLQLLCTLADAIAVVVSAFAKDKLNVWTNNRSEDILFIHRNPILVCSSSTFFLFIRAIATDVEAFVLLHNLIMWCVHCGDIKDRLLTK